MRLKPFSFLIVCFLVLSLVLIHGVSFAWEKGHIKVIPAFKVEEKWDSNVFYDSTNEKDDFITVITPGISGEFGFGASGKHKIRADYKVDLGIFNEYHDQNYGNHDVLGEIFLDFNDYTLTVSDNFLFTSDRAGTEFEDRTLRRLNTASAVLGAYFNKLSFDFGYSHYIVDYHSTLLNSLDRYENTIWTTGYVQVMPKTKALLEYQYRNIQYKNASGRNANVHTVLTGATGDITPKITGTIKGGYKYKGYENSVRDDFSSPVAYTSLNYNPIERVNILLAYDREGFESTYLGNNYYTGDHFTTDINYKLPRNFIAKLDGQYFLNRYPEVSPGDTEKRKDQEWAVGGGLDYVLKDWLVAGIGYRFHQRASNIGSRDYDQHVVSTDVRVVF